jgi:hypothetical protein
MVWVPMVWPSEFAAQKVRMRAGHLAHHEEDCLHAFGGERIENLGRAGRNRPIVEGQNHLVVLKGQGFGILHEPQPAVFGRIERDHAGRSKRLRPSRTGSGLACAGKSEGCERRARDRTENHERDPGGFAVGCTCWRHLNGNSGPRVNEKLTAGNSHSRHV